MTDVFVTGATGVLGRAVVRSVAAQARTGSPSIAEASASSTAAFGRPPAGAPQAMAQVTAVRDDPAARFALLTRTYRGPVGRAPKHPPHIPLAVGARRLVTSAL